MTRPVPAWPPGWTLGVIGCGSAGSRLARILTADLGVPPEVVTGYDRTKDPAWPSGLRLEILTDGSSDSLPQSEVWLVCTPAWARAYYYWKLVGDAMTRAIFAEKPFIDLDNCAGISAVVERARRNDVATQTGYCWRWHPSTVAAMAWLRRPEARGPAVAIASCFCDMATWPGDQRSYAEPLLELSHELDTLRRLLGSGRVAAQYGYYPRHGRRDGKEIRLDVDHKGGSRSTTFLRADFPCYYRSLELTDAAGRFRWHTDNFKHPGWIDQCPGPETNAAFGWSPDDMYRDEMAAFLRSAIDGEAVRCDWADGLAIVEWAAVARVMANEAAAAKDAAK